MLHDRNDVMIFTIMHYIYIDRYIYINTHTQTGLCNDWCSRNATVANRKILVVGKVCVTDKIRKCD